MLYKKLRLLLIGCTEADIAQLSSVFSSCGRSLFCQQADTLQEIREALDLSNWDAIITEYTMPGYGIKEIVTSLKGGHYDVPLILYTSTTDEESILAGIRNGASHCIPKGHAAHLMLAIDRELEYADLKRRKRQADSYIYRLTYYDELTGLPKRNLFCEKAAIQLNNSIKNKKITTAVYFIKIKNLSRISKNFGYEISDALLQKFANHLSVYADKDSILSHITGEGFAFLRAGFNNSEQARKFASQLLKLTMTPYVINEHKFHITLKIGISIFPDHGDKIETLLANAVHALTTTRKTWHSASNFYHREADSTASRNINIGHSLVSIANNKEDNQDLALY